MKKLTCIALILFVVISLAACSDNSIGNKISSSGNTVNDVLYTQMEETTESETGEEPVSNLTEETEIEESSSVSEVSTSEVEEVSAVQNYDVDLIKLGKTMVYSEVYNMLTSPADYIGKTVRMYGKFAYYQVTDTNGNPVPDMIYFACIIPDATACCQQGMEFVLAGEHIFPDDYPPIGSYIKVSGVFDTYEEYGITYCHLIDAAIE